LVPLADDRKWSAKLIMREKCMWIYIGREEREIELEIAGGRFGDERSIIMNTNHFCSYLLVFRGV